GGRSGPSARPPPPGPRRRRPATPAPARPDRPGTAGAAPGPAPPRRPGFGTGRRTGRGWPAPRERRAGSCPPAPWRPGPRRRPAPSTTSTTPPPLWTGPGGSSHRRPERPPRPPPRPRRRPAAAGAGPSLALGHRDGRPVERAQRVEGEPLDPGRGHHAALQLGHRHHHVLVEDELLRLEVELLALRRVALGPGLGQRPVDVGARQAGQVVGRRRQEQRREEPV